MKKRHVLAAVALALAIPVGSAFAASAAPKGKTDGHVLGPVVINDDGTASVTARYVCQPEFNHLWVSAKQVEDRHPDPALQSEGSSGISAGWWQAHPQNFTCDGTWHTDTFLIGTFEFGIGELEQGQAWIQFCLTAGDETVVWSNRWAAVK